MHPTALLGHFRPNLADGFPEPECAIGDGEPRRHVKPRRLRSSSKSRQSCALSQAPSVKPTISFFRRRADQHQDGLPFVFEASLMDAIGPDVDVGLY